MEFKVSVIKASAATRTKAGKKIKGTEGIAGMDLLHAETITAVDYADAARQAEALVKQYKGDRYTLDLQ